LNELKAQLKHNIMELREKELHKLATITEKAVCDQLENIINDPIYNLDDDFWNKIKNPYIDNLSEQREACEDILQKAFECEYDEMEDFIATMETKVYSFTTDYIKKTFKDINTNLMRRFNKEFKKESNGKPRVWQKMEEGQIRELHTHIKKVLEDLTVDFKYIKIPKNVGQSHNTDNGVARSLTRSDSVRYERLLSEAELNKVKDKFNEEADF